MGNSGKRTQTGTGAGKTTQVHEVAAERDDKEEPWARARVDAAGGHRGGLDCGGDPAVCEGGAAACSSSTDASAFDLHYSQFSLESLDREEKLMELGSRNFFLCPKRATAESGGAVVSPGTSNCSKEAGPATKKGLPWLKFMDFLL
ncbi:hypothetical protein Sango_1748400 [Sesamum angolense]|uniref:DUF7054 domain-containing protein n=1 Tax=Sesamum angolense TaxID=2727404 RepID=A0AAE1WMD6_9LAMI|nr:hypothetical protein Sango_1748400 [Sesamum angolense]